jgi:hypothetical protein
VERPAYAAMMQAAGASMEPEELVGAPGGTPTFTEVRATPQTRVAAPAPAPTSAPTREVVTALYLQHSQLLHAVPLKPSKPLQLQRKLLPCYQVEDLRQAAPFRNSSTWRLSPDNRSPFVLANQLKLGQMNSSAP